MPINTISDTNTLATVNALNDVAELLEQHKGAMIASKDPLVNMQLQHLLKSLYQAQHESGLLAAPVVLDTSNLSSSDLIAMVMSEVRKTSHLTATTTIHQIRANQNKVLDNNAKTMQKLADADKKLKEAADVKNGLGIFKWVMLAISVITIILSVVATVASFGAAAPKAIAVSVAVLAVTAAMFAISSIPVDGENHTAMDLATDKLSKAIAETAKADLIDQLKEKNKNWDNLSTQEQQDLITEAEETGVYSTMAIMITLQLIIAVAIFAATLGAGSGSSATVVGQTGANAAKAGAQTALNSARAAIQTNLGAIQTTVKVMSAGLQVTHGAGAVAAGGAQLKAVDLNEEAANEKAQAEMLKALVQMLSRNNKQLTELVAELYEDIATTQEVCASILKTDHETKLRMNTLTHGAHV